MLLKSSWGGGVQADLNNIEARLQMVHDVCSSLCGGNMVQQHNVRRGTYTSVHSNAQMETNVQLEKQNEEIFCQLQRDAMLKTYSGST